MKIKILLFTFISLFLGSCTLTKRYHSIGYQVDWKSNKNTTDQVNKNNPITVNKSTTPLLSNKLLVGITDSKSELSAITKSDVQQSRPIEQSSIARPINVVKTNTQKILPPDSTKIVKIAALKLKMKKRLKRLGLTTLFSILTLGIIDILDGDNSGCPPFAMICMAVSGAFFIALIILIPYLAYLFYKAAETTIQYLSFTIRHPTLIGFCLLLSSLAFRALMPFSTALVIALVFLLFYSGIYFLIISLSKSSRKRKERTETGIIGQTNPSPSD
ncbi:MAG: hypothetical protein NTZ00_09080 [Bacteroidetes bacterium]|nr:hypothetical protein [Bacteroidota bacterium]